MMRTTLDIDDTVLAAARSLAQSRGVSLGAALSEIARRGLRGTASTVDFSYSPFPVLVSGSDQVVTDELVAEHRDA